MKRLPALIAAAALVAGAMFAAPPAEANVVSTDAEVPTSGNDTPTDWPVAAAFPTGCTASSCEPNEEILGAMVATACSGATGSCADEGSQVLLEAFAFAGDSACGDPAVVACIESLDTVATTFSRSAISGTATVAPCPLQAEVGHCSETYDDMLVDLIANVTEVVRYQVCANDALLSCVEAFEGVLTGLILPIIDPSDLGMCGDQPLESCVSADVESITALLTDAIGKIASTQCAESELAACVAHYGETISGLVEASVPPLFNTICETGEATQQCLARYQHAVSDLAFALVEDIRNDVCGNNALAGCIEHYRDTVVGVAEAAVRPVYGTLCTTSTATPECVQGYSEVVADLVSALASETYDQVCGESTPPAKCAERAIATTGPLLSQLVETITGQDCPAAAPDCAVQLQGAVVKAVNESLADLYTNACPPDAEVDECAARYASTVTNVLADMDASLQDPCSLTGTCGVQLSLTSPDGGPLSSASYRMYVRPDVLAPEYVPPLLSAGRTDISGRIQFNISTAMRALPAAQLPDPGETLNVVLLAVDDAHRWMVDWNIVLPTSGTYSEAIVANTDMAAELSEARTGLETKDILGVASFSMDVVPASDPEEPDPLLSEVDNSNEVPGEDVEPTTSPHAAYEASLQAWANAEGDDEVKCPEPKPSELCKVKSRSRWVKIAPLHADKGLMGKFGFLNTKETSTQVAGKLEGYAWKVTGWAREGVERGSYGTRQKDKEFHRVILAQYRYHLWKRTPCCDPGMKNSKQWYMGYWTGDLARSSYEPPSAPFDPEFDIQMDWGNATHSTQDQKNEEFGFGVGLAFLELNSQTGYSDKTDLSWYATAPHCDWKRLWAKGQAVTEADIIYAGTRDCD